MGEILCVQVGFGLDEGGEEEEETKERETKVKEGDIKRYKFIFPETGFYTTSTSPPRLLPRLLAPTVAQSLARWPAPTVVQ